MDMISYILGIASVGNDYVYKENNNLFTRILKTIIIILTVGLIILPFVFK